jgi:hypothetical protein
MPEAALVPGMRTVAPANLAALLAWLRGTRTPSQDPQVLVVESGDGLTSPTRGAGNLVDARRRTAPAQPGWPGRLPRRRTIWLT